MNHSPEVRPSLWAVICTSGTAAAKQIAKNISKNVSHIGTVEIEASKTSEATGSSGSPFKSRMAELVILLSLFRITQD